MRSKKPSRSGRPTLRTRARPQFRVEAKPRVAPKPRVHPKSEDYDAPPLGRCVLEHSNCCETVVRGPAAIRLRHGAIQHRQGGYLFKPLPFDDGDKVKWLCMRCSHENYVLEDGFQFGRQLQELTKGWCCICRQDIEPYPLETWSSAIALERGFNELSSKGPFYQFMPRQYGHLHYCCLDDLGIELWRIIERSDEPDYSGWAL